MEYQKEFSNIVGLVSYKELEMLMQLAEGVPNYGKIVEIGSYMGKSTIALANSVNQTVDIDAIDLFPDETIFLPNIGNPTEKGWPENNKVYYQRQEFIKNTSTYPNIKMIVAGSSRELNYPLIPHIDLLFLDASHRNPSDLEYIQYFMPRMKPNCIICGHDYGESFPDVVANVRMLENYYSQTVSLVDTFWWIKVING